MISGVYPPRSPVLGFALTFKSCATRLGRGEDGCGLCVEAGECRGRRVHGFKETDSVVICSRGDEKRSLLAARWTVHVGLAKNSQA